MGNLKSGSVVLIGSDFLGINYVLLLVFSGFVILVVVFVVVVLFLVVVM